jgi:hypothetical protein
MVAVRVSRDHRLGVVGSPDYFGSHPKPSPPHDLPNHRCINLRGGSSGPYRWEFEKDGEAPVVDVSRLSSLLPSRRQQPAALSALIETLRL